MQLGLQRIGPLPQLNNKNHPWSHEINPIVAIISARIILKTIAFKVICAVTQKKLLEMKPWSLHADNSQISAKKTALILDFKKS